MDLNLSHIILSLYVTESCVLFATGSITTLNFIGTSLHRYAANKGQHLQASS